MYIFHYLFKPFVKVLKIGDFFQKIIEFATLNFTPKNETATNPGQFVI